MKTLKYAGLFVTVLFFMLSYAQQQTNTKFNIGLLQKLDEKAHAANKTEQENELVSLFVEGDTTIIRKQTTALGGIYKYAAGDIAIIQLPLNQVTAFAQHEKIQRIEYNEAAKDSLNDQMILNNNVFPVHWGYPPLPQGYDGSGVVVGIIDNGVDYTHPDFQDENGRTRVKYYWDQGGGVSGSIPDMFKYGQEWDSVQIEQGLAPVKGDHGTMVAGSAAGNGLAIGNYKGVAPKADIIVVAISQSSSSVFVDGVRYIFDKAKKMGKPAVVNISYTSGYLGSHDGKNMEALMIDNLIKEENGRVVVAAAGNQGHVPWHIGYEAQSDTLFTWAKYNSRENKVFFTLWMDSASARSIMFSVGADKVTPYFSFRGNTSFFNTASRAGTGVTEILYNNAKQRIGIIQTYSELTKDKIYGLNITIIPDSTTYFWRLITTGKGRFDAWTSPGAPGYFAYGTDIPDSSTFPDIVRFKAPDVLQTITNSFQCSPYVITVGNYMNRKFYTDVTGIIQADVKYEQGELHKSSSKGPTRDGRIKPEITASGERTLSSTVISDLPALKTGGFSYTIGAGGMHRANYGTSSAAPVVAGIAALYLQQHPEASYMEVKNALMNCAKQDTFTGANLPNNYWGYGKADAFKMLTTCGGFTSNTELGTISKNEKSIGFNGFPNPAKDRITIHYDLRKISLFSKAELKIYDILGQQLKSYPLSDRHNIIVLEDLNLPDGLYFYSIIIDNSIMKTQKLVISDK